MARGNLVGMEGDIALPVGGPDIFVAEYRYALVIGKTMRQ
jgi:hypothetical protein